MSNDKRTRAQHRGRDDTRAARFWSKVAKSDGCWLWNGSILNTGYGQIDQMSTHRLSWTLCRGPIPEGLLVLHNCPTGDNRACVNPAHLFLGTHADNIHDMIAKGRNTRGEAVNSAKLTAESVAKIREEYDAGSTQVELSGKWGVCQAHVSKIVLRKNWKHVGEGHGGRFEVLEGGKAGHRVEQLGNGRVTMGEPA